MGSIKRGMVSLSELFKRISKKSICKVKIKEHNIDKMGFFCRIPFPDFKHLLPVLILNYDSFVGGQIIEFTMDEDKLSYKISFDNSRIAYTSHKYNITIIEIKEKDNLDINSFLKLDEELTNISKADICLIQYINSKLNVSFGKVKDINNNNGNFSHCCSSSKEALACPLINLNNFKVIGIHIGIDEGMFLQLPLIEFNNYFKNINIINNSVQNNDNYINALTTKNTFLISEIKKLEEEINKEKNENKILKEKINNLENILNEKCEKLNKSLLKIKELEEIIKNKSKKDSNLQKIIKLMEELEQLKSKLPFDLLEKDKLMVITFISEDESIHYSTISKNSENLTRIENLIYQEHPEYFSTENILISNKKVINSYDSLEKNGIKNNDIIIIKRKNQNENKINII